MKLVSLEVNLKNPTSQHQHTNECEESISGHKDSHEDPLVNLTKNSIVLSD